MVVSDKIKIGGPCPSCKGATYIDLVDIQDKKLWEAGCLNALCGMGKIICASEEEASEFLKSDPDFFAVPPEDKK
jgi:hypothetical protein